MSTPGILVLIVGFQWDDAVSEKNDWSFTGSIVATTELVTRRIGWAGSETR